MVESYREKGRVKQRIVATLGRKDLLAPPLGSARGDARAQGCAGLAVKSGTGISTRRKVARRSGRRSGRGASETGWEQAACFGW
ncbi:protein of unknown function [Methylacidimicrobium sp. AP8]|nr:protein of unknown function [Methylacidimicrobium sp. AP8]